MLSPDQWRSLPVAQQPEWPDRGRLERALTEISGRPPLVFRGETEGLIGRLAEVAAGRAFLLQAGDCAESFDAFSEDAIAAKLRVILQMAVVLTYSAGVPVVKVGRIAGQFAKPRSSSTENIDGVELPVFRGHIINAPAFDAAARAPDPGRLLTAYDRAAGTLNAIRGLTKEGFAGLGQVHAWNQAFVATSEQGARYEELAEGIGRALRFMRACGVDLTAGAQLSQVDLFTSHEALVLCYEEALTHGDAARGYHDGSAHMLWVGERTRQLDGGHIAFLAAVQNPIGAKLGPSATPEGVLELCRRLDPERRPGRLTLITRMGCDRVEHALPPLLAAVRQEGHPVIWACDPMHGNTFVADNGRKTRHFDAIVKEVRGFFAAHRSVGTWPGGLHVELTGEPVTECIGGEEGIAEHELSTRYETICDPRLNGRQSLDLAFRVAELLVTPNQHY